MTIAHPPERVLTELERADEATRAGRARSGQLRPRTLHTLCEQAARLVPCRACPARPGAFCGAQDGCYHLARFAHARRRGLITADEMTMVLAAAGDVFTNSTIIKDGGR